MFGVFYVKLYVEIYFLRKIKEINIGYRFIKLLFYILYEKSGILWGKNLFMWLLKNF